MEKVREYVGELSSRSPDQGIDGLALFANESLGLWRPLFYHRAFQPELSTDRIPHLVQLVRLTKAQPSVLMIVTYSNGADLYQVALGNLAVEERMRRAELWSGDGTRPGAVIPGRHFERAEKNVRHTLQVFRKNRQRVVAEAATLFDRVSGTQIVLVGTAQNLAAFERELPEPLRTAVIARKPRPREWEEGDGPGRSGVLASAAAAVAEQECRTAEQIVEEVVGESTRCGLAVLGPAEVSIALNEGRVHRLVLEEDFAPVRLAMRKLRRPRCRLPLDRDLPLLRRPARPRGEPGGGAGGADPGRRRRRGHGGPHGATPRTPERRSPAAAPRGRGAGNAIDGPRLRRRRPGPRCLVAECGAAQRVADHGRVGGTSTVERIHTLKESVPAAFAAPWSPSPRR